MKRGYQKVTTVGNQRIRSRKKVGFFENKKAVLEEFHEADRFRFQPFRATRGIRKTDRNQSRTPLVKNTIAVSAIILIFKN